MLKTLCLCKFQTQDSLLFSMNFFAAWTDHYAVSSYCLMARSLTFLEESISINWNRCHHMELNFNSNHSEDLMNKTQMLSMMCKGYFLLPIWNIRCCPLLAIANCSKRIVDLHLEHIVNLHRCLFKTMIPRLGLSSCHTLSTCFRTWGVS